MKKFHHNPPQFFLRFFRWFCHPELRDYIEGDLVELYNERIKKNGKRIAGIKFIIDVLLLFRPGIIRSFSNYKLNQYDMFRNYLKIAWRNMMKSKMYSFLNVGGMTIGIAATLLILLWVRFEFSFDAFYPKTDRIYQLFSRDINKGQIDVWGNTAALIAPELKKSYEDVETDTRYRRVTFLLKKNENHFNEAGAFTDPSFLSMFSFPMLEGGPDALADNSGIVLTRGMAVKLFGGIDCMGETVIVNDNDAFKVTGVMENLPNNTNFDFAYLLPWHYVSMLGWDSNQQWDDTNAVTYVLLEKGASADQFGSNILNLVKNHTSQGSGLIRDVLLQPLSRVHLYNRAVNGVLTSGIIVTVRLFILIAISIFLITCINFVNLSTARSEKRSREVGVRKIIGAGKTSLVFQFITESFVYVLISFIVALGLVQLSLPSFGRLTGISVELPFNNLWPWIYAVIFILAVSILAGGYPAFYLSSRMPLKALKGSARSPMNWLNIRKILVVSQFTLAILLSLSAIFVHRQMRYAQDRDAGYERRDVAYNFMQGEIPEHFESIKNELLNSGAAVSVTRAFSPITRIWSMSTGFSWQGSDESDAQSTFLVFGSDEGLTSTFGIRIKEGRDLDIYIHPGDTSAVLLNESAVSKMQLKEPVGATIEDAAGKSWLVVGVVNNFIIESPFDIVNPMIIEGWTDRYGTVNFKLNPERSISADLSAAEGIFKKYNPEYPFEYFFADDYYNRKFQDINQTGKLAGLFAALTIFISCLGLFGLASYMTEIRTKEIAVRKVLGASVPAITYLLSKDFLRLVVLAVLLSAPLTWYLINSWLNTFNYRESLSLGVFLTTGVSAILIAFLTVLWQTLKTALLNPVDNLRSE